MIVPNREIANTNIFSSSSAMSNSLESIAILKNIQMNAPITNKILTSCDTGAE